MSAENDCRCGREHRMRSEGSAWGDHKSRLAQRRRDYRAAGEKRKGFVRRRAHEVKVGRKFNCSEGEMSDMKATTLTGVDVLLEESAVAAFKSSLRGQLLTPADEGYDAARI